MSILATELSEWEVRQAVESWLRHVITDAKPSANVEDMKAHIVDGKTVAFIANLAGGGFCICGRDDRLLPVYLYSPQGTYDKDNPNHQYVLWEIETRTKTITQRERETSLAPLKNQPALEERAYFWQALISGNTRASVKEDLTITAEPSSMILNLTSTWHQFDPYHNQCPGPSSIYYDRSLVGCVGTAMAQILYYWKWPHTGTGSNTVTYHYRYENDWIGEPCATDPQIPAEWPDWDDHERLQWTSESGGTLWMKNSWDWSVLSGAKNDELILNKTPEYLAALDALYGRLSPWGSTDIIDFGAATYDWSILRDSHGTDPHGTGYEEVGELNYHVAGSINTNFGMWASSSSGPQIEQAVKNHFRYDTDARTDPTNITTMTDEIQWLRPVALGGQAEGGGGHMWVVLGYDKATDPDRLFLMNMGWRSGEVEWYTWDHYFPVGQEHVTRIAPVNTKFVGNTNPGDGSPDNPYENIEEALLAAPDESTLIFKAGSTNTFDAGTLVIDRPLILKGRNAKIL